MRLAFSIWRIKAAEFTDSRVSTIKRNVTLISV